jgi:uncharacterized protein HemY
MTLQRPIDRRLPQISTGFVTRLFNYGSLFHLFSDDSHALLASLERAVHEDPDDKESWGNLGCLLFHNGDHTRADACFDRAVKIDRSDATSWHNAGNKKSTSENQKGISETL